MSPADIVQKLWNYCNALGDEAKGRSVLNSKKSAPFTAEEVRKTDCRIYQDQRPDPLCKGFVKQESIKDPFFFFFFSFSSSAYIKQ